MKKSENLVGVQMYLSQKEEWTNRIPILEGAAVSYAQQGRVDEYMTGEEKETTLHSELTISSNLGKPPSTRVRLVV